TLPFEQSRRRWFGTSSCKPVPRGRPSSVEQLRTSAAFRLFAVLVADYNRDTGDVFFSVVLASDHRPGFFLADVVVSTNETASNVATGTMSAMNAFGTPSGYTAPIWRDPRLSWNHSGAVRRSSAKSGSRAAAKVASRDADDNGGTVKFLSVPPPCGM